MKTKRSLLQRVIRVFTPIVVILAAVFIALSAVKLMTKPSDRSDASSVSIGTQIPDFDLQRYPSGHAKISEIFGTGKDAKKVLLINFWASWCDACITEMPSINALRAGYKDSGFEVLGIDLDEKPAAVIPRAVKELGILFPIYLDPEAEIAESFDVHAIPFTLVIDRERRILDMESGDRNWNSPAFRKRLEEWLKK